jgi:uncharacterized protein YndB with AHSA1/START domain
LIIVPAIRHSTLIRRPPAVIFELLATGEAMNRWFTTDSEFDARAGGPLRMVWRAWGPDGKDVTDSGEIVACEPPRLLSFTWGKPPSTVTFTLTPVADGTRVALEETGIPPDEDGLARFAECATGWGEALTLLQAYAEAGIRLSRPVQAG